MVTGRALVVWDIDGTLIGAPRSGRMLFETAVARVLGRPDVAPPSMHHGSTDHAIIERMLLGEGFTREQAALLLPPVLRELESLTTDRDMVLAEYRPFPGSRLAIEAVAATGALQSYVTGNSPRRAWSKLAAFGLDRHLDMRCGGFGDGTSDRWRLVEAARRRAGLLHSGEEGAFDGRTIVIGDTINDIRAARESGASAVAVATGVFTREQLCAASPDLLLDDLVVGLDDLVAFVSGRQRPDAVHD